MSLFRLLTRLRLPVFRIPTRLHSRSQCLQLVSPRSLVPLSSFPVPTSPVAAAGPRGALYGPLKLAGRLRPDRQKMMISLPIERTFVTPVMSRGRTGAAAGSGLIWRTICIQEGGPGTAGS